MFLQWAFEETILISYHYCSQGLPNPSHTTNYFPILWNAQEGNARLFCFQLSTCSEVGKQPLGGINVPNDF